MPPITAPKVQVKISSRFCDEQGGRLYGPGIWPVDPPIADRLIANGRATLVGADNIAKNPKGPKAPPLLPATNPRIPPAKDPDVVVATPLPEDFPSRDVLIGAGVDSVQKLQDPNVKETLAGVEGLTSAQVTKIGLAISKV